MKGLVLKDLYNVTNNLKQLILIILFMSVCFLASGGVLNVLIIIGMMFAMMTMTTFNIDEYTHWEAFALTMPITRNDYVKGKYMTCCTLSLIGSMVGLVLAIAGGAVMKLLQNAGMLTSIELQTESIWAIAGAVMTTLAFCLLTGFTYIPFLIKFGSSRARVIIIAIMGAAIGIGAVGYISFINNRTTSLEVAEGYATPEMLGNASDSNVGNGAISTIFDGSANTIVFLLGALVLLAVFGLLMYKLSCRWFNKKEF